VTQFGALKFVCGGYEFLLMFIYGGHDLWFLIELF
jgi:hypothetical protein